MKQVIWVVIWQLEREQTNQAEKQKRKNCGGKGADSVLQWIFQSCWYNAPFQENPALLQYVPLVRMILTHTYMNYTPFTHRIKGVIELNRVPGKRGCPWVKDWQFSRVVIVAAAVELCELCDHVQMQGNGGSKWILGRKDSSRFSNTPLAAESTGQASIALRQILIAIETCHL